MTESKKSILGSTLTGSLFIAIGLGVFAIRLNHAGPYSMPHGGALYGGLGALALGCFLLWPGKSRLMAWIAIVVSPVALFPALYSIGGESEEVISLYATDSNNRPVDLRLWIVDRQDGAWVGMGREKAIEHQLDGASLEMLRAGKVICVVPVLHEDRSTAGTIHAMKVEKYSVAQASAAIGLYPREATASTVALRLDPCPDS